MAFRSSPIAARILSSTTDTPTRTIFAALMLLACCARANAQQCDSLVSRTTLSALSGRLVRSVRVVTEAPPSLPGPAAIFDGLHTRTRESTVRKHLAFVAGDTLDTLLVAASLRRLRTLRYLTDASVEATACAEQAVDLTIRTRDEWSTKPAVQVRSSSSALGLTERNLFGTGREASVAARVDRGRVGVGASLRDPFFLGGPMALTLGNVAYRDGSEWYATLGRRERSVFDRWSVETQASRAVRAPRIAGRAAADGMEVRRTQVGALAGRRVHLAPVALLSALAGLEYERTTVDARPGAALIGPYRVRREFAALDLGLARRSVAFDTVTWLLAGDAISDVPLAYEFDALVGVGKDRVTGSMLTRVDLWAGRIWTPSAASLLVADVWTSGYHSAERWTAGTIRGSLAMYAAAPRGMWTARLFVERLFDPDPDVMTLASTDPTVPALPPDGRLAEGGAGFSVERSIALRSLSRSWRMDAAGFGAFSARWDPAAEHGAVPLGEHLRTGLLGVGLRLTPKKSGRAVARLDVGFPVASSGGPTRPVIAVGISPLLHQGRTRDGRSRR